MGTAGIKRKGGGRLKLREDAKIDLITLTSIGVRLTPIDRQPVHVSRFFEMHCTSAESNVLNVSASLGMKTKILTRFVKDSPVAKFIQGELRRRNIEYEGLEVEPENPWGVRHQMNIADKGYGLRGPRVYNDRAGEVGRTIVPTDFDLERIFVQEGCRILHLSGLIAAMSPETSQACLAVARIAKANGTLISFDLNYRASFWKNREEELRGVFSEIASISDILIGNEEDYQLALGIEGPSTGSEGEVSATDSFKQMICRVAERYDNPTVYANTLRQVESVGRHQWGALLHVGDNWYVEEPRAIDVLDRIGGGDGFVGGLLYGILKDWREEEWLQFGWACGALAVTMNEDFAWPVDEAQVWEVYSGNARVKR